MYYRPRRRGSRAMDYFMPFLIIICVGVIIVLLFNLWKAIFSSETTGDAFMHINSGSVQMKMWGTEDYFDLSSDALVMKGDEIKTSADAQIIIEFFDGTIMRLDGNTNLILQEIYDESGGNKVDLLLIDGKLWINKLYKDSANETEFVITMGNTVVTSSEGSIYDVENDFEEIVRVFHGEEVEIDILAEDGGKVVESEKVGVGQELVFTETVLQKYWAHQSPSDVKAAVSDDFKESSWFLWNQEEDDNPTEFSKAAIMGLEDQYVPVEPEVIDDEEESNEVVDEDKVDAGEEEEDAEEEDDENSAEEDESEPEETDDEETDDNTSSISAPTITSVSGITETNENDQFVITDNLATITGSISGADKVVVNGYTLQKFKPGDQTWTYFANADYGLMEKGDNTYEVYAIGSNGEKSESLFVKVYYDPPEQSAPAQPVEEAVEETPADESTDSVPGTVPEDETIAPST